MEHVELAGVHSGDSACVIPPVSIKKEHIETIKEYTQKIAKSLKVCGLMNMQYAIEGDKVYVLESNPRASRTVPLVSKVCNVQMANLATRLMLGSSLESLKLEEKKIPHFGAKESVFPFDKFENVDPVLGPEMRSTGEVLGMSENFGLAFYKSQEAANSCLPDAPKKGEEKTVLISLSEKVNQAKDAVAVGKGLVDMGFKILATEGTAEFFAKAGIPCEIIAKLNEGRPNVLDVILNKEVCLAINTPSAKKDVIKDEAAIRKAVIKYKVPYITTLAAAKAAVQGILASSKGKGMVRSVQEFHKDIKE